MKRSIDAVESTNTSYNEAHEGTISWLQSNGALGLDNFVIKKSDGCDGVGCFALKSFQPGELLFAVPQSCIFGYGHTKASALTDFLRDFVAHVDIESSSLLTSELLIWVHMCYEKLQKESFFYNYFSSLSECPPVPLAWPSELLELLSGTNLGATITEQQTRLNKQVEFLHNASLYYHKEIDNNSSNTYVNALRQSKYHSLLWDNLLSHEAITWAMGHYLSRRYPGKYARDESNIGFENQLEAKEINMENLGALVPYLDILNHNHDQSWLRFEVRDDMLHIICNYPLNQVIFTHNNI
jgi:hypothetical protein